MAAYSWRSSLGKSGLPANETLAPLPIAHYRKCDATWQPLAHHLRGAGILSRRFARKIGLKNLGELLGLLHDLGKYGEAFQGYLRSAVGALDPDVDEAYVDAGKRKGKIDHSTAGAQLAWLALSKRSDPWAGMAGQIIALCVASHHSGLVDCITPDGEDNFLRRMSKGDALTHLDEASAKADARIVKRIRQLIVSPGLRHECERLLSAMQARHVPPSVESKRQTPFMQKLGLAVRFAFSCLVAADRIDTAHFENPQGVRFRQGGAYRHWHVLADRLEKHLAGMAERHPIDRIRRDISLACLEAAARPGGIYTLSVATGGGKTLASLRFALHHARQRKLDRIIYVIPYTSIIDQNAGVARAILEPAEGAAGRRVVLEHHSNLGAERQSYEDKLLCDDWDAPVVCTTMVQFLDVVFGGGTRGVRRMHQLANAVLVFDEVQTLPIRCVHLFNNALDFLVNECGSTVVLCTATQPLLHAVDCMKGSIGPSAPADLMPTADALFRALKRVDVRDERRAGGWDVDAVGELAVQSGLREGSCLAIVNTKASARALYECVAHRLGEDCVFHLSTGMCPAHRKAALAKLRSRLADPAAGPTLCISTQLIEAGVDVDFRVVVRYLAGLDSIAQAAGRCNRNGGPEPGILYIVNPAQENLGMLPDIAIGRDQAQAILDRYRLDPEKYDNDPIGRRAMQEYYQHYFFQRRDEMSYPLPDAQAYGATVLQLLSANASAAQTLRQRQPDARYLLRQSFMSAARAFKAIDSPTESVIVPFGAEGERLIRDLRRVCGGADGYVYDVSAAASLLREAQQYTVNVTPGTLKKLKTSRAVTAAGKRLGVYCLSKQFYSMHFGFAMEHVC